MTMLKPQEVYLLERYISLEYLGLLRDNWGEMISHVGRCLDEFMADLPPDYRKRPLPEQPDAVWGERILPNFRKTFEGLCNGFVRRSQGDLSGLESSHGPFNDFRGQVDFSSEWMTKADEIVYANLLNQSVLLAGNIIATIEAAWSPLDLTDNYTEQDRGPLDAPANWPAYRLNKSVSVDTGSEITRSGIYLPDTSNSCAQFLHTKQGVAPQALAHVGTENLINPETKENYGEEAIEEEYDCKWILIERASDIGVAVTPPTLTRQKIHRLLPGDICPQTGFYVSPARIDARRRFQTGESMPDLGSNYGETIWQWDVNQD